MLGPLAVRSPDGPVRLAGANARALLAALLLERNRPVSAERLAEILWGADAAHDRVNAVRVQVSRLRSALATPDALVTTPAGYELRVRPEPSTPTASRSWCARGAPQQQPERAAGLLREALALWRGPALADLATESFAQREIARLEEARLEALELRIEAELASGRHTELVAELQELAAAHPLRERVHGQLMLALYRSGRQADALDGLPQGDAAARRGARAAAVARAAGAGAGDPQPGADALEPRAKRAAPATR